MFLSTKELSINDVTSYPHLGTRGKNFCDEEGKKIVTTFMDDPFGLMQAKDFVRTP